MVTQNPKANPKEVSSSPEKFSSAAPLWLGGMLLLLCAAFFIGCGGDGKSSGGELEAALKKLESTSETERLTGLDTLSSMGEKAKPHADKIAALLKDTSPAVRATAVSLLGDWGHSSPEVVQEVSGMAAGDEDADARASALTALTMLGANDEFVKVAKGILAGDDADLKTMTLLIISESSKESVTALKTELEAIAGGSNKGHATDAKAALKMLE